ncbi:MAG: Methyltransferase type 11 [bacterium]|nr:Methyltransferase type 11 [bacterium]
MASDGPDFYDDDSVFATYAAMRKRTDSPNETMEAPVFHELVGDVRGLRILDLGCGTASLGRELLARGARTYVGVDGSRKMAAAARATLAGTPGVVVEHRIETFPYGTGAFDLAVSRLALHYVADVRPLFASVAQSLVDDGRFVFSIEHPVITSCSRGWKEGTVRQDWLVDGYFDTGPRVTSWLGGEVQKYHRTVEDYFEAMRAAGFAVEQLREASPRPEMFTTAETYERRKRIPLFLIIGARRV